MSWHSKASGVTAELGARFWYLRQPTLLLTYVYWSWVIYDFAAVTYGLTNWRHASGSTHSGFATPPWTPQAAVSRTSAEALFRIGSTASREHLMLFGMHALYSGFTH